MMFFSAIRGQTLTNFANLKKNVFDIAIPTLSKYTYSLKVTVIILYMWVVSVTKDTLQKCFSFIPYTH